MIHKGAIKQHSHHDSTLVSYASCQVVRTIAVILLLGHNVNYLLSFYLAQLLQVYK